MQKAVNVFLCLIIAGLIFGCGTGRETTPVNITPESDGSTTWTSSFGVGSVKIHRSFKYVGVEDKSDSKANRFYHVWKRPSGEIIYIVDFSSRTGWNFPEDYDGGLGSSQNPKEKGIVYHRPLRYTVWNSINKKSYAALDDLDVKIPECKFTIQTARFSPSRKSAYIFTMFQERKCDDENFDQLLDDTRAWVKLL